VPSGDGNGSFSDIEMIMRHRALLLTGLLFFCGPAHLISQDLLEIVPVRGTSKAKLYLGKRSVTVDLDAEMDGSYGSMPGNPPHRFKVLFTAKADGYLYLVTHVRSRSPVSDPMAPCGGDAPQSILWIKVDKALKKRHLQSEVYESCSFNYYDSRVKRTKNTLVIDFGGSEKRRMTYDNRHPEKGIDIKPI
jgi:hypothetical protein